MLSNVKNPTSGFVSFSTLDQRYINFDPHNGPTLKCLIGVGGKLLDLSKAFDYVSLDLLLAQLAA